MKRLYVKPTHRGETIGKQLVLAVIQEAKTIGYHYMRLDMLPNMSVAMALYQMLGFTRIEPYYEIPVEGALAIETQREITDIAYQGTISLVIRALARSGDSSAAQKLAAENKCCNDLLALGLAEHEDW